MATLPQPWHEPYEKFKILAPTYHGNIGELESIDLKIKVLFDLLSIPLYHGVNISESTPGEHHYWFQGVDSDRRTNYSIAKEFMKVIISKFGVNARSRWGKYESEPPNCWKPANGSSENTGETSLYLILHNTDIGADKRRSDGYNSFHGSFWNKMDVDPNFKPTWITKQKVPQWDILNCFRTDDEVGCRWEPQKTLSTSPQMTTKESTRDSLMVRFKFSKEASRQATSRSILTQPARNHNTRKLPEDEFNGVQYSDELRPPNFHDSFKDSVEFEFINFGDPALALPPYINVKDAQELLSCGNGRMLVRQAYVDILNHLCDKDDIAKGYGDNVQDQYMSDEDNVQDQHIQNKDTTPLPSTSGSQDLKRAASPQALQGQPSSKKPTLVISSNQLGRIASIYRQKRHTIITGHPGIGKTYFLSYLLYWRTIWGRECIIEVRKDWHFYFSAGGVKEFQDIQQGMKKGHITAAILSDEEIWYIADGQPDDVAVFRSKWMIVVIASPKKETFKAFQKHCSVETLYMPPFDWNDTFGTAVFCEFLTGDQIYTVWRNFVRYGPSARTLLNVLVPRVEKDYQSALRQYKSKLKAKIIEMLRSLTTHIQMEWLDRDSHTVILTSPVPGTDWQEPVRSFITDYVAQLFAEIQDEAVRGECAKLFIALEKVPEGSTYRGRIFEGLFHKVMEHRATLQRKNIKDPKKTPLPFTPGRMEIFNRLPLVTDMVRAESGSPKINRDYLGVYFRPVLHNFQSVDSFILLDGTVLVFQITCAQSHPVKASGLAQLMDAMPSEVRSWPWILVFVVPEKQVAGWKEQKIECYGNNELIGKWAAIEQEVMGVADSLFLEKKEEEVVSMVCS